MRLAAPPVEGAANKALIGFLSEVPGLREADIRIRSRATARLKVPHLSGNLASIMARHG